MLDGRTVLVTGASTGIGRTTALTLAKHGARVLAGVRDPAAGEALGTAVTPVRLDVTSPEDIAAATASLDRLDGLVNNAGIAVSAPLEYVPIDELRRQLEVNTVAQVAVTQACLPALRRARGRIVNISSISGLMVLPLYGPYAASKYALEALTDALRLELRAAGIRVVAIEPGSIATPIWDRGVAASDAIWEALPEPAHDRYGDLVATLRGEALKQPDRGLPPSAVADVVLTALTAKRPRARYRVGRDAKLQAALTRLLPPAVSDRLLLVALKSRR